MTGEPKPRALDFFCGAGGVSMGLHRAGFDVVGVDINPQPQYPFAFIQGDALAPPVDLRAFDFVWASPPCQAYTGMQRLNTRGPKREHPRLIDPIRAALKASGRPYAMENVPGAPMVNPALICGSSFGLGVWRHRLIETNWGYTAPPCHHKRTPKPIAVYGDHPQQPGDKTARVNRARTLAEGQNAMGIDWMLWRPLTQAIPPAYAEHIGRQFLAQLLRAA